LVRALLADGLVDELHLFVFPLAQGTGQRLFADSGPAIKLALAGSEAYSNGALHLTYRPAAWGPPHLALSVVQPPEPSHGT
jgi:dihydrofolate reductase